MALDGAVLEIDFFDDPPNFATTETAVFRISGNIQIDEGVRPNFLVNEFGEQAVAVAETALGYKTRRRAYTIDAGAGEHTFDIQFLGWEGSTDEWGTGSGTYDASGEDALKQISVLNQVLTLGTTDSLNPARLYVGEYTDGTYGTSGKFADEAPLSVQIDSISGNVTAQDGKNQFNGSLALTEINKVDTIIDIEKKKDY